MAAHDRIVLGTTGPRSDRDKARMEDAMYPGLSDADCQVAGFRYRKLVADGQYQQFTGSVRPGSANTSSASARFQQRLGTFLVRAGHCLQGLHTITKRSAETLATGERVAIA